MTAFAEAGAVAPVDGVPGGAAVLLLVGLQPVTARVLQQEADLTAGHRILRTTGLIAVSAQDPDELERAVADIEQAAIPGIV